MGLYILLSCLFLFKLGKKKHEGNIIELRGNNQERGKKMRRDCKKITLKRHQAVGPVCNIYIVESMSVPPNDA